MNWNSLSHIYYILHKKKDQVSREVKFDDEKKWDGEDSLKEDKFIKCTEEEEEEKVNRGGNREYIQELQEGMNDENDNTEHTKRDTNISETISAQSQGETQNILETIATQPQG